jgi:hypothetical protein
MSYSILPHNFLKSDIAAILIQFMNLSSVTSYHMLFGSETLYFSMSVGHAIPLLEMGMACFNYETSTKESLNTVYAIRPHGLAILPGFSVTDEL